MHGSRLHINPSSWARVVPIPRLRLASPEGLPGEAARVAIAVLMPFHTMTTTDSVESVSGGLAKSLSKVLQSPSSSPKDAGGPACSRDDASHGLSVTSPCRSCKPPEHTIRCFMSRRRLLELPHAPDPSCTAQPRARGPKFQLSPSSWARVVPVSRLRLAPYRPLPQTLQSTW